MVAPCSTQAARVGISSGVYDRMLVGFNPATRIVTGYFQDQTGQGQFSCTFYLTGRLRDSVASIASYFPEPAKGDPINGQLLLKSHRRFAVRLQSEHGGCWNVRHFADEKDLATFSLDVRQPWTSIAVVKAEKAYLFSSPIEQSPRKGYVVKDDGVGVRASQPGWLLVDFVGGKAPVSGWIRQSEFYPTPQATDSPAEARP